MMEPRKYIIIGGNKVWMGGTDTMLFPDTGLEFTPDVVHMKPRTAPVDLITIHDTAGRGKPPQVFKTLLQKRVGKPPKGLSVHFCIGADGMLYQFCDPALWSCAHMGLGNSRSVGIELVNLVIASHFNKVLAHLEGRPIVRENYRAGMRVVIGHTGAQHKTLERLVDVLLEAFRTIPAMLPYDPDVAEIERVGGSIKSIFTAGRLPPDYKGIAGHLHFTDAHVDPCMDVFYTIAKSIRNEEWIANQRKEGPVNG